MEVSVIIPIYNKKEYLQRSIDSILSQDFPSFEIIAVNDGSTDGSGEYCDTIALENPQIRVFHTPNQGVTAARALGTRQARGKYIMFVDADDQLAPHSIQNLYRHIIQSQADEVIGAYVNQHQVYRYSGWNGFQPCYSLIKNLLAMKNSFCVLWAILFKKEVLDGCLDTPRQIKEREDVLTQIKFLMKEPKVFFIPDIVYIYEEGLPNNRTVDLQMIEAYDKELKKALTPQWDTYKSAFLLHQIKTYENFIDKKQFYVFDAYYKTLRKCINSPIPLMDRIVIWLPAKIAYFPIHCYKKWCNGKH